MKEMYQLTATQVMKHFNSPIDGLTSTQAEDCLLYTSPSPRDRQKSRMPSSA